MDSNYSSSIQHSLLISREAASTLKKADDKADRIYRLNKLKKLLILNSTSLIKSKIKFKNELNSKSNELNDKVQKLNSFISNPLLKKFKVQLIENNLLKSKINNITSNLPSINLDLIGDLNQNNDALITRLKTESNLSLIDDLKNQLSLYDIEKFKLIKLNDVYYQNEKLSLLNLDRKWNSELGNIRNFLNNQLTKFNFDLKTKIDQQLKEIEIQRKDYSSTNLDFIDNIVPEIDEVTNEEVEEDNPLLNNSSADNSSSSEIGEEEEEEESDKERGEEEEEKVIEEEPALDDSAVIDEEEEDIEI